MHTMILSAATLIASAAALGAQTPSQAQHPARTADDDVVVVSYADLDLARPDQARILDRRLNLAAHRVCDDARLVISHYRLRHLCIREALADARSQVASTRALRTAQAASPTAIVRRAS
jgi:UrcA family protein